MGEILTSQEILCRNFKYLKYAHTFDVRILAFSPFRTKVWRQMPGFPQFLLKLKAQLVKLQTTYVFAKSKQNHQETKTVSSRSFSGGNPLLSCLPVGAFCILEPFLEQDPSGTFHLPGSHTVEQRASSFV